MLIFEKNYSTRRIETFDRLAAATLAHAPKKKKNTSEIIFGDVKKL